jgi:hypothetical protein
VGIEVGVDHLQVFHGMCTGRIHGMRRFFPLLAQGTNATLQTCWQTAYCRRRLLA